MLLSNLIFFFILFFACIVSGLVGFGCNILALPFLSLFFDMKLVVPVLVLAVLCNGLPRLLTQYTQVSVSVYLQMLFPSILGGFLGMHLSNFLPELFLKFTLALFLFFFAVKGLLSQKNLFCFKTSSKRNPIFLLLPFFGGILQAAFACGGPLFNLYILQTLHQKEQIRATTFAIGSTSAALIALQYFQKNVYHGQTLSFVTLLLPAVFLAFFVSERIFQHLNRKRFLFLLYLLLLFTSIITCWQAIG